MPIFAVALLPLLVASGGVVDYTNAYDQRMVVQAALDSGVLAAGKRIGLMTTDELKAEANNFYLTNIGGKIASPPTLNTVISAASITGTAQLHVPTYFLGIIGLDEIVFDLKSSATLAMGTLEVALVLDNSGSMAGSKISTLKTAATNLTNTLYNLAATSTKPDPIKVALVPFAGAVNVGPSNRNSGWMDTTGVNPYHGENFEASTGNPPVSTNSPAVNVFSLFDSLSGSANAWAGCVEERPAPYDVQDDAPTTSTPATMFVPMFAPDEPDNWTCTSSNGCSKAGSYSTTRYNGAPGGTQSYNNYLPDVGDPRVCGATFTVSRANPAVFTQSNHGLSAGDIVNFGTTGALYTGLTAGTNYYVLSSGLSTNSFRVSTTSGGYAVATSGSQYGTHYLTSSRDWTCSGGSANCAATGSGISEQSALMAQNVANKNLCKYGSTTYKAAPTSNLTVSMGGSYDSGPNFMCTTDALTPLTTTKSTITTKISNMEAYGITNITAGLMWGWRVLSPGAPFTDGRDYSVNDNQKIIILMTDGENTYFANGKFTKSYYGAWSYIWKQHLGTSTTDEDVMQEKEEDRMALACSNAKKAHIKIYTVAFQVTDGTTLGLLSDCASEPSMAYQSSNNAALLAAFTAIGNDISLLRVAE